MSQYPWEVTALLLSMAPQAQLSSLGALVSSSVSELVGAGDLFGLGKETFVTVFSGNEIGV